MSKENRKELIKQGDIPALSKLINQATQKRNITASLEKTDSCLRIVFTAETTPDLKVMKNMITKGFQSLEVPDITTINIFGKQKDAVSFAWSSVIRLGTLPLNHKENLTEKTPEVPRVDQYEAEEIETISVNKRITLSGILKSRTSNYFASGIAVVFILFFLNQCMKEGGQSSECIDAGYAIFYSAYHKMPKGEARREIFSACYDETAWWYDFR